MKQHGEVQAQGKCRHAAGRIFREGFIQKVQSADQECQQQCVLPHLRCDDDDRREQGDEEKSDQAGKAARGFG